MEFLIAADEIGVKLEIVGGQTSWEFFPGILHQEESYRIQSSIKRSTPGSDCGCFHLADVYVKFAEGSVKRPDLAIWCSRPNDHEGFVYQIPEAVIEIVSPGSHHKDLVVGPPFYLAQGIRDVVVFDPRTGEIFWHTPVGEKRLTTPTKVAFACGCEATV